MKNFSKYTVKISNEPSYYGSECSDEDGQSIAESIAELVKNEFPGIETEIAGEFGESSNTTGLDESVIFEINQWIAENWTAAL